jgi:hypothetical protein
MTPSMIEKWDRARFERALFISVQGLGFLLH